jgi:hypothetical protein
MSIGSRLLPSQQAALDRVGAPRTSPEGAVLSDGARVVWVCGELERARKILAATAPPTAPTDGKPMLGDLASKREYGTWADVVVWMGDERGFETLPDVRHPGGQKWEGPVFPLSIKQRWAWLSTL